MKRVVTFKVATDWVSVDLHPSPSWLVAVYVPKEICELVAPRRESLQHTQGNCAVKVNVYAGCQGKVSIYHTETTTQ